MKTSIFTLVLCTTALLFTTSCDAPRSPVTGMEYNNLKNGGFEANTEYEGQETGPGLVLIEGGTFMMGRNEQDIFYDWNAVPRRVTVSSFYMDETEVRNLDYLEYLHWTALVFNDNFEQVYKRALPDTLVWRQKLAYNEPYVNYYLRHPSFQDYPVVGINWLQANDFCAWRGDRVNEYILVREGILDYNPTPSENDYFNTEQYLAGEWTGKHKTLLPSLDPKGSGQRPVKLEDGILLPLYRLPTEAEWEYAAYGLIGNTIEERITDRKIYPWNGHWVRNPDEKFIGQFMANYKRSNGDQMGVSGYLNDNADITAPVFSYWPNDYGLYNMGGNVSEWVLDVYRPLSPEDKDDFRPYRGNVFKTAARDTGTGQILISSDVVLDADSNIISKPGEVRKRDVSIAYNIDNLDERRNYKYADNIDIYDGDIESSVYYLEGQGAASRGNKIMYQAPQLYVSNQSDNNGNTTLIDNKAHVYKGGSWNDRAYWMSPGTRRFLDQRQATSWIGFRCVMDRVGSPAGLGGR